MTRPELPLLGAVKRLDRLPAGLRVRSAALRAAGQIITAWVAYRPEEPAVSVAATRLAQAIDRHLAQGRLAWRTLRRGGTAGLDPAAHSLAVGVDAAGLAHQLGWPPLERRALTLAGLVHDVGWTIMPDGEPRAGEHAHATDHLLGLRGPLSGPTIAAVRAHHERWDGQGGPLGLEGSEIPRAARALAVADWANAHRGRTPSASQQAAQALAQASGAALDPSLVRAWLALNARRDDRWSA